MQHQEIFNASKKRQKTAINTTTSSSRVENHMNEETNVYARVETQKCFSSAYQLLSNPDRNVENVSKALISVETQSNGKINVHANIDSGGSRNLASPELLQNIKRAKDYGHTPISMITINDDSPVYDRMGELHFQDHSGAPIVLLCYVQAKPIKGHHNFVLISNNTLVDLKADLNYQAKTSKEIGVRPLKRLTEEPYHYRDSTTPHKAVANASHLLSHKATRTEHASSAETSVEDATENKCKCAPRLVLYMSEEDFLRITGGRWKKKCKRLKKVTCYMSEIQLQELLNRTASEGSKNEAMDMTTVNGVRISKFDIKAIKIGKNVPKEMRERLVAFNMKFVGKNSVFPTENGAPRILEQYKDNPYSLELLDQYTTGRKPKPLPTIKAIHYHGKPATRKILEHFVRTTPVVEKCDDPRCFSRLVIVPKRDPGTLKDSPPTSYRVTMDALINNCLKPVASTLPLATDEIKKLHGYRFFLKADAMHAFWSIPLDEESKKLMAFQTHEGVFAWSRLTMGCRPSSQVQQTAFHTAMDKHLPPKFRHRIALYADDMAAGANDLEELFEIYTALVVALDKAGIQVKASKVEFGVEEVTFHNYKVIGGTGTMSNTTTPKDENLDPIKSCRIPQTITQLKAFLGATQQMAQYVPLYALIAAPLHALTRKDKSFPSGSKWIKGSDYDMAFHHIKSLILDKPLYLWNKDNNRHLFIEVDSSDDGWGACAYQYAKQAPTDQEEGKFFLLSKLPKRIIQWVSKAWTAYEKQSLPIFYKETIARILAFGHMRNLIETQQPGHGVTCYSDHLPGIKTTSLSNKGKLSTWRIHEVSDLMSIVETIYKAGPTMTMADPLSRLARHEDRVDNLDLPVLLQMLLSELPDAIKQARNIRVNAEKDTAVATRIVQRWRSPSNPISNTVGSLSEKIDFLIAAPYADKLPNKVADYIRRNIPFAILIPLPLLNEIERTGKSKVDEEVRERRLNMKMVISTALGQGWLINHPLCKLSNSAHKVFFATCSSNKELHNKSQDIFNDWTAAQARSNVRQPNDVVPASLKGINDVDRLGSAVLDDLFKDGASRKVKPEITLASEHRRITRSHAKTQRNRERNSVSKKRSLRAAQRKSERKNNDTAEISEDECIRKDNHPMHVISTTEPPLPLEQWPPLQDPNDIPTNMTRLAGKDLKKGLPEDLVVLVDSKGRHRILVPKCQRAKLVRTEHETMLHVKGQRVHHELVRTYFWPDMKEQIKQICQACASCQRATIRQQNLTAEFVQAEQDQLPLPRQAYGIDFYGHESGEILVAVDLCTREIKLWFLKQRKQESVVKALLSGLIFQQGVPLLFRNDEAPEFVKGAVASMNRYLGIRQVTTGGHNPRSNAVVERVMQLLNACLTKCDDSQYKNVKDYLPAIAFAHNTTFHSAINCTPFEAGHGLRARTITEARASPRLQIIAEGGRDLQEQDIQWEKSLFPKICKLAERLASEAQRQSQWHKRMNAHNLNQTGSKVESKELLEGAQVYFYKPPSQQEVLKKGRKAKHLAHYHGPAIIKGKVPGRERQFIIEHNGKQFKRDANMIVPQKQMLSIDISSHNPVEHPLNGSKPALYHSKGTLREEDLILCKTEKDDQHWYLAEISKVYPDEIEIVYYTTPSPRLADYQSASKKLRQENLAAARFRKTWFMRTGKNAGRGTIKAPFPKNPELRLWTGKLPTKELPELLLATGIKLDPKGFMNKESLQIATTLPLDRDITITIEDEEKLQQDLRRSNAMFMYAEKCLCSCKRCRRLMTSK